ncbi:hypothetical protein INT43_003579 [Umbelopsis isabellina]|uniref:FAD-binding PCMH-type domain-containing protein n=1 Tax=Mortierella isabellina TaxID=91625 RepID=A0A8H7UBU0_MORIS|nr:hypothetical protein INT43_003579 [Umbelopsis isabellina]
MCQFCGVDPAFAAFFENTQGVPQDPSVISIQAPAKPNFFRLKPKSKTMSTESKGLQEQQLKNFQSSLSPEARVITESDGSAYTNAIRRWSKCAIKPAKAVIMPTTAEDVSKILLLAKSHTIPVAVKCGGHSPGGASSSDGGIVIDLGLMNSVSAKADEKTILVGGGALWRDVTRVASEYGLSCVSGSTSHVGVSGLTLHGGYGYLAGEHGLAVDNLVAAQVVLADGSIVWANDQDNTDLFFAIRGAGSRFGVITKLVIRAHQQRPNVWGGPLTFPGFQYENVVEALNTWYDQGDVKAAAEMVLGKGVGGQAGITIMCFYNGSEEHALVSFAPFLQLRPTINATSEMPYWRINTLSEGKEIYTDDYIRFASGNLKPPLDAQHIRKLLDSLDSLYEAVPGAEKTGCLALCIQPDGILKKKRTDMAFCWRDANFDVGIGANWSDPKDESKVIEWQNQFQKLVSQAGDDYRVYGNHEDFRGGAREFGINYLKLLQLKKKYDPSGLFRTM